MFVISEVLQDLLVNDKISMDYFSRFGMLFFYKYMMISEMTQVNGLVFVADFHGLKASVLPKLMNTESGKIQKAWQVSGKNVYVLGYSSYSKTIGIKINVLCGLTEILACFCSKLSFCSCKRRCCFNMEILLVFNCLQLKNFVFV